MLTTIPFMATVAQLQREYRRLVEKVKTVGEPLVILSNGKPDVVVMDLETYQAKEERLRELETEYLLRVGKEALEEYRAGKTVRLKKGQTLMDLIG